MIQECIIEPPDGYISQRIFGTLYLILEYSDRSTKARKHADKISFTKIDSGFFPTAKWLFKIDEVDSTLCPLCDKDDEDIIHILNCSQAE